MMQTASELRVTVVTPTLNQGRFLPQTLRTVAAQTHRHVEHIVMDAGSTDGSVDILRDAERRYHLRWSSEPDDGMYDGINNGIRQASGDILAYLNSDDLYLPWTLEVVTSAFARWPEVDIVYGDALRLLENSGSFRPFFQHPFHFGHMTSSGSLIQPAVFWRRRVMDSIGLFDSQLRFSADLDYWLRAGAAGCQFRRVDEILAVDRAQDESLSATRYAEMATEIVNVRSRHRGGRRPTLLSRLHGRARRELWARVLWLRFATESGQNPMRERWSHVRRLSSRSLRLPEALLGVLPLIGPRVQRTFPWRAGALEGALNPELPTDKDM